MWTVILIFNGVEVHHNAIFNRDVLESIGVPTTKYWPAVSCYYCSQRPLRLTVPETSKRFQLENQPEPSGRGTGGMRLYRLNERQPW